MIGTHIIGSPHPTEYLAEWAEVIELTSEIQQTISITSGIK